MYCISADVEGETPKQPTDNQNDYDNIKYTSHEL
jgi:hypothetical protein